MVRRPISRGVPRLFRASHLRNIQTALLGRITPAPRLLSPYRRPPRPANDHDGTILTAAPDVLWGTDATMVQTAADGRVWVFAALDHWNSEVVGHHVSTDGSRF